MLDATFGGNAELGIMFLTELQDLRLRLDAPITRKTETCGQVMNIREYKTAVRALCGTFDINSVPEYEEPAICVSESVVKRSNHHKRPARVAPSFCPRRGTLHQRPAGGETPAYTAQVFQGMHEVADLSDLDADVHEAELDCACGGRGVPTRSPIGKVIQLALYSTYYIAMQAFCLYGVITYVFGRNAERLHKMLGLYYLYCPHPAAGVAAELAENYEFAVQIAYGMVVWALAAGEPEIREAAAWLGLPGAVRQLAARLHSESKIGGKIPIHPRGFTNHMEGKSGLGGGGGLLSSCTIVNSILTPFLPPPFPFQLARPPRGSA